MKKGIFYGSVLCLLLATMIVAVACPATYGQGVFNAGVETVSSGITTTVIHPFSFKISAEPQGNVSARPIGSGTPYTYFRLGDAEGKMTFVDSSTGAKIVCTITKTFNIKPADLQTLLGGIPFTISDDFAASAFYGPCKVSGPQAFSGYALGIFANNAPGMSGDEDIVELVVFRQNVFVRGQLVTTVPPEVAYTGTVVEGNVLIGGQNNQN